MTLAHETVLYDVHDCKVAALLSDRAGQVPTYGPLIDVFGIQEVGLDPNFVTAELKGDATVVAKKGRIDRVNFSGTYSKLSLDVRSVLLGSETTDIAAATSSTVTGSTTNTSANVTGTGYTTALIGKKISGTGIPANTYIIGVTGTTAFTMSQAATATGAGVTITIAAEGERVRSRIAAPASLPYFLIKFKIEDTDEGIGDVHCTLYKAQVTGGPLIGSSTDNFSTSSFDAEGIAIAGWLPGNGEMDEHVILDTELFAARTALALP